MLLLLVLSASAAFAADGKLIHLHFYFHEVDAGTPNATVVNVASLHKYVNAAPPIYGAARACIFHSFTPCARAGTPRRSVT